VVWAFDLPWGDKSQDPDASNDWITYAKWRRAQGDQRSLYDAPAHVLEPGEQSELRRLLDFAIAIGWDTLVASRPAKVLLELSHHDRITVHARSRQPDLISALQRLGVKRAKR
jgi:hypothetical protein